VFWCSAAYLLGNSAGHLFYTSMGLLCIPLIFSAAAYFLNRPEQEKPIRVMLDKIQEYNLEILVAFISAKRLQGGSPEVIKKELILHDWDHLLVELALERVFTK